MKKEIKLPFKYKVISRMMGGMMNESTIIENIENNAFYVLYVSTKQANEMVNRELEKENQAIVYELGITSKNIYFDTENGIKVNEFIPGNSLNNVDEYDVNKVAKMLRTLHSSSKLSKEHYHPLTRLRAFIKERESLNIQIDPRHDPLFKLMEEHHHFMKEGRVVLSHNDFQKSNIVKSNDDYYVIDFEFMMNNTRIYDIACFGNNSVSEGYELLKAYFDNNPSEDDEKRYYLWRIFVSLQWYNVALIKDARGEGKIHNIDFKMVADGFMNNALEAFKGYTKLIK